MKVYQPSEIEGLLVIEPKVFADERGVFFETYSKRILKEAGLDVEFVQDNQSSSKKGVLRGLHFQNPPYAQGKLVRVLRGSVWDVAVDIRKGSPTYGRHYATELNDKNNLMFYIPPGFAHGFYALEDNSVFSYKCTNYYNKESEDGILWNDSILKINWPDNQPILSDKDKLLKHFGEFSSMF